MKIKKIAQICAGQKTIYVHNQECRGDLVRQWVGDSAAMYPLDGLPYMDDEALLALMDVPPDKRDKWTIRDVGLGSVVSLDDIDPDEVDVLPYDLTVNNGRTLMPFDGGARGTLWIQQRYLAPTDDIDIVRYCARPTMGGGRVIAIKSGLVLMGIISPLRMSGDINSLGRQLMDIANGTIVAEADSRRVAVEADNEDQIKMEEDDDVYPDQRR